MKKTYASRLAILRKTNLRIGYAISLSLILAAFSWTSERAVFAETDDSLPDDVIVVPPTWQEPAPELPPPPGPEKRVELKNQIIIEAEKPDLLPPTLVPSDPAPVGEEIFNKEPAPVLRKIPPPPPPAGPEKPFLIVENMPLFGNCNDDHISKEEKKLCSERALMEYLKNYLRYPAIARENGIEGMVVIRFIVEKDGKVSGAKIVRDIGGNCGEEALRVVKNMPDWTPGRQRGRAVRVQYNLPVKFRIQ